MIRYIEAPSVLTFHHGVLVVYQDYSELHKKVRYAKVEREWYLVIFCEMKKLYLKKA